MSLLYKIHTKLNWKIRKRIKKVFFKKEIEAIKNTNFVIVADNCWGGQVYNWYEKEFNTPFIGLAIFGECYIKLLSNFDYYMSQTLIFKPHTDTKYPNISNKDYHPMALLDDIEIHFTHYKSEEEARSKWYRRTERMLKEKNKDNYFFKLCDTKGANQIVFEKFHQLPYKNKISFIILKNKKLQNHNHIGVHEHLKNSINRGPDGLQLFKISSLYVNITKWLKDKTIVRTCYTN